MRDPFEGRRGTVSHLKMTNGSSWWWWLLGRKKPDGHHAQFLVNVRILTFGVSWTSLEIQTNQTTADLQFLSGKKNVHPFLRRRKEKPIKTIFFFLPYHFYLLIQNPSWRMTMTWEVNCIPKEHIDWTCFIQNPKWKDQETWASQENPLNNKRLCSRLDHDYHPHEDQNLISFSPVSLLETRHH